MKMLNHQYILGVLVGYMLNSFLSVKARLGEDYLDYAPPWILMGAIVIAVTVALKLDDRKHSP